MSLYRKKQFKTFADKNGYFFTAEDENGLIEMVKDCSIRPRKNLNSKKVISNIISHHEVWEQYSFRIFDFISKSTQFPERTMLMVRSINFDFPFLSIQPRSLAFPPKQPILKRRRKVKIETFNKHRSHVVYTTDMKYWYLIDQKILPILNKNPYVFIEVNNFFVFYAINKTKLHTTKLAEFLEDGLALIEKLNKLNY